MGERRLLRGVRAPTETRGFDAPYYRGRVPARTETNTGLQSAGLVAITSGLTGKSRSALFHNWA